MVPRRGGLNDYKDKQNRQLRLCIEICSGPKSGPRNLQRTLRFQRSKLSFALITGIVKTVDASCEHHSKTHS